MKCLVTGGAGFVGSHIAEQLLRQGHQVCILDNFSAGKQANLDAIQSNTGREINLFKADILDMASLSEACKDVDAIFHQAALVSVPLSIENPLKNFSINTMGSVNVFECARIHKIPKVIFASSAAVYGDNADLPLNESISPVPQSPYGLAKLQDEEIAAMYCHLYGMNISALRYFNIFGERQDPSSSYSGVISIFMNRYLNKKNVDIFGDGSQTRDFIYVKDIAEINISLLNNQDSGFNVYNLGTANENSLNQLLDTLDDIFQYQIDRNYLERKQGDIYRSRADNRALLNLLSGFTFTPFKEGLRKLADSLRS